MCSNSLNDKNSFSCVCGRHKVEVIIPGVFIVCFCLVFYLFLFNFIFFIKCIKTLGWLLCLWKSAPENEGYNMKQV